MVYSKTIPHKAKKTSSGFCTHEHTAPLEKCIYLCQQSLKIESLNCSKKISKSWTSRHLVCNIYICYPLAGQSRNQSPQALSPAVSRQERFWDYGKKIKFFHCLARNVFLYFTSDFLGKWRFIMPESLLATNR